MQARSAASLGYHARIKKGSLKEPPGPKPAARIGRAWLSHYLFSGGVSE